MLFFSVAMTVARFMGDRLAAMIAPNLLLAVPLVIAGVLLTIAVVTAHVTMMVWAYIFIGLPYERLSDHHFRSRPRRRRTAAS